MNDYIKLLTKPVRIFGYFGKIFDYGSQFSFSSGNIKNKAFASSEGLVLKGLTLISSEKKCVGRVSEKKGIW